MYFKQNMKKLTLSKNRIVVHKNTAEMEPFVTLEKGQKVDPPSPCICHWCELRRTCTSIQAKYKGGLQCRPQLKAKGKVQNLLLRENA